MNRINPDELCLFSFTNQTDCMKYDTRRRIVTEAYFLRILREDIKASGEEEEIHPY